MVNRTLAYLILLSATAIAGCILVYNFYQAQMENKNISWNENSFQPRQIIQAEAAPEE